MNRLVYNYKAQVLAVPEPDVMDVLITVGFRLTLDRRIYLAGCRYPELRRGSRLTAEQVRDFQTKARAFLALLLAGRRGILSPLRPNKFVRVNAKFYLPCELDSPEYPQLTLTAAGLRMLCVSHLGMLAADKGFDIEWGQQLFKELGVTDIQ